MTEAAPAIEAMLAEYAELEQRLSDPELHADAGTARKVGRRFAQVSPIVATYRKLEAARGDLEAARELAADDASFAAEVDELAAHGARAGHPADRPAGPARSARRRRHRAGGQVRRGRRGIRAVRRGPGPDVHPLRRAARLDGHDARRDHLRPRRLQGRDAVDRQQGRLRRRGVVAAEVRGRRAPRAAGPRHRIAGPRAHLGRRRAGLPRARGSRTGPDRRVRSAHRRVPRLGQGRPGRQHHRLRGAHHPPADRHRRDLPERAVASCRTRRAPCRCSPRGCRRSPRSRRSRRVGRPGQPDPHRRPQRADPHLQLSRRTGSPTTGSTSRRTTSTRCSTATSTRCSTRWPRPTSRRRLQNT